MRREPLTDCVIEAWNLMGGEIDWNAVGPVAEMLGIEDPAMLLHGLTHIRDHFRKQEESERR